MSNIRSVSGLSPVQAEIQTVHNAVEGAILAFSNAKKVCGVAMLLPEDAAPEGYAKTAEAMTVAREAIEKATELCQHLSINGDWRTSNELAHICAPQTSAKTLADLMILNVPGHTRKVSAAAKALRKRLNG